MSHESTPFVLILCVSEHTSIAFLVQHKNSTAYWLFHHVFVSMTDTMVFSE